MTDLEIERQIVTGALIQNVSAVAGPAGQYRWFDRTIVTRCPDAVVDALAKGFGKPIVATGIEVHPAPACAPRLCGQSAGSARGAGQHRRPDSGLARFLLCKE